MKQITQTMAITAQSSNAQTQEQPSAKEYKSFLNTVSGEWGDRCMYSTRLDTYGCGCAHNCSYCYARYQLAFRNHWFPDDPRVADIVKIEKAIKRLSPGSIVRLGGMTDCFQPLELKKKVTLETIKLLNQHRIGYLIVTKSPMVSYPYFTDVMDQELAHIQVTVTCLDAARTRVYENAPPPDQRIRAILTLQEQGFDTAIRLSPLLEEYMDFDELNSLGINKAIVEFLRINSSITKWFPRMSYKKYTLFHGNYYHLPLDEKLRIISKVKLPSISVCEKIPEHYEYWKEHINQNPSDCCNLRIRSQQNVIKAEDTASNPATSSDDTEDSAN